MNESQFESHPQTSQHDANIEHIMDTCGVSRVEAEARYTGEYPVPREKDTDNMQPLTLNGFNRYGLTPEAQKEWRELTHKGFLTVMEILNEIDEGNITALKDPKEIEAAHRQSQAERRANNDRRRAAGRPVID